jgi:hypothetical protein
MNGKVAIDEDEFVDTLGAEVHEPACELGVVRINDLHEAACEADEGEGARVRAEDDIDGVHDAGRDDAATRGVALAAAAR